MLLVGCKKAEVSKISTDVTQKVQENLQEEPVQSSLRVFNHIEFTSEELNYIEGLKEQGILTVAMHKDNPGYYFENGEATGYNYLMINKLAEELEVELDIKVIDLPTKYFWLNGETPEEIKTDPNFTYVPDLLHEVQIYCDNMTHLPWRQQFLNQIANIPVRSIMVMPEDTNYKSIPDLNGLTVAIVKDTSYEMALIALEEEYYIDFKMLEVLSSHEGYAAVRDGLADCTIVDSDMGFLYLSEYPTLKADLPVTGIQLVGWAVKKEDEILASIVSKYMDAIKATGLFNEYWMKTYIISYDDYLRLIVD